MKKFLWITVCLCLIALAFAACDESNSPFGATPLATPTNVVFSGTLASWDAVPNADLYVVTVYINSSSYSLTQAETSYNVPVTTIGDYSLTVKARSSARTYKDSEPTVAIVYHLGAGTELDPILIGSREELEVVGIGATIAKVDSVDVTTPLYYSLTRDIDLAGEEWAPIGEGDNRFQGHMNGQGYTVSNYSITVVNGSYYGLFKGILNGSVTNLNISNYTIDLSKSESGTLRIGGLAGSVEGSKIYNCNATGGSITVLNSSSSTQYIGQLIGYLTRNSTLNIISELKGCSVAGELITDCKSQHTGGLVGYSSASEIEMCNASGTISATGATTAASMNVGGIVGYIISSPSIVKNCYSTVNLTTVSEKANTTGALIGLISSCRVEACYAAGAVSATAAEGTVAFTGFIGKRSSGTPADLYYDYEIMNLGNPKDIGGNADYTNIYSKTTAEMKTEATFVNWDFVNVWAINPEANNGYPTLLTYIPPLEEEEEE